MYSIYEVQEGDTISTIANKLALSPEVIMSINGINITTPLAPNSYIVVPKDENNFNTYTVKQGDTLYSISQANNIDYEQLSKLNGLNKGEYIYPNQEIIVPKSNVSFYITSDKDTLNDVIKYLNTNGNTLTTQNETIYLLPDQLIISKL